MGCDMTLGTFFQNRNLFTGLTFQNDIRQYQCIRITGNWINHPHTLPAFSAVQSNLLHHNTLLSYKNSDSVLVKEKGICHLCKLLKSVDYSLFAVGKFRRTDQCAANRAVRSLVVLVENKINSMPSTSVPMCS